MTGYKRGAVVPVRKQIGQLSETDLSKLSVLLAMWFGL
jgi:hypothetical protein